MKNQFKLVYFSLIFTLNIVAQQNILISQEGNVNVQSGDFFYDAGGVSGNDGNTDYTITLLPQNAGEKVCLDFTYFKTQFYLNPFGDNEEDALFIYDGISATGTDIGKLMGDFTAKTNSGTNPIRVGMAPNTTSAAVFRPTLFCATNPTGALTLDFNNTSSTQQPGWIAEVKTYIPTENVGCNIDLTADQTTICAGETVTLDITGTLVSAVVNTDFNNSNVGTGWAATSSATFTNNVCAAPSLDGSTYLWMQSATAPRELKTNAMDVSSGGTISFEYRQAKYNSDGSPCEAPDIGSGTTNEGVYVQYSTDGGATWNTFKYLFSHSLLSNAGTADLYNNGCGVYVTDWTKMTYPIPYAAQTPSTQFRWIQPVCTSASTDNWGLDNVIIASPKSATISLRDLTAGGTILSTTNNSTLTLNVNPTVTTTYEATISDGVSSCTSQVTVTVGSGITPTFTAISDVCQGSTAPTLPTSSTNNPAITGSWDNAVSTTNAGTTLYTFTPDANQCAAQATMNITVTNSITPTFTAISDLCQGSTAPTLPTSSTNNPAITGSWDNAVSTTNAGTTLYTFTPDANQCAAQATMNITVTNSITPTFTAISDVCQGSTAPTLPTSSTNNPAITGSWDNVVSTTNAGTTLYTFTPDANQCAAQATMNITVTNSITPTFTAISDVCQGSTAPTLPTSSTNNPAITGSWDNAVSTTNAGTTLYTFTPDANQCAAQATMNITVTNSITPTFTAISDLCQGSTAPTLPTSSTNNPAITGSWDNVVSTTNAGTTLYTFTPDANQCAGQATLNITVTNSITPTFTAISDLCQGSTAPTLPTSSTNNPAITGSWDNVVSTTNAGTTLYTFTPDANQCAAQATMNITVTNSIMPTFTAISDLCQGSTAPTLPTSSTNNPAITGSWDNVVSTTNAGTTLYTFTPDANQCAAQATMNITVTNSITPTFTAINDLCQGSSAPTLPTSSTNNPAITGSWDNAVSTTNAGTTLYTFTPDANQCAAQATMNIEVLELPNLSFAVTSTTGCLPLEVGFINTSNVSSNLNWDFGNGSSNDSDQNPTFTYNQSGCHDVTLTATLGGCTNSLTLVDAVCVSPYPTADFTSSTNTISAGENNVNFTNLSENTASYIWNFGDNSESTLENPSHYFLAENIDSYTVSLIATSEFGCSDTIEKTISITPETIFYIPNAFTPDGNQYNNVFKPVFNEGISEVNYTLYIFNRWGEIVFESQDKNAAWDGTNYTGYLCPDGVYTWKIQFSDFATDNRTQLMGHVNLLR
jgi:gliding motility-associated-like protein